MGFGAKGKMDKNGKTARCKCVKRVGSRWLCWFFLLRCHQIRTRTRPAFSYALSEVDNKKRRTTRLGSATHSRRLLILPNSSLLGRTKFGDTNAVGGVVCPNGLSPVSSRGQLKCDGTRAETGFRVSAKRTSPFKSAGASVLSTTGSRGVRISGSNAGYTMF